MNPNNPTVIPASALRERALARLAAREDAERAARAGPATEAEEQQTLHELRVHQIELELQNEELRRAQLELEASRQRWFELYDLAPVGYCNISGEGLILKVNLAAAELMALPRAALVNRRFSEFIEPADQRSYYSLHGRLFGSGQPQDGELRMRGAKGAERWVQVSATLAAAVGPDEPTARIVLVDITVRRQAQAAEAALRLAEQTHRGHHEFLSRVSHEFRTPLNAILGFSQLLLRREEPLPTKVRQQLQHIHDAGSHLVQMVTDLLDISRAGAGRLALRITRVDALAAVREALNDLIEPAQRAGVTLMLETHGAAEAGVSADPTRLRQVLQNLLSNAIKYNRAGGRVLAELTRHDGHWRVHIVDNGLGMTEAQQAALFQPFNRLGREAAGIEGTGLGLVIARELVQAMGGRISVRSAIDQGSEFLIDLPAAAPVQDQGLAQDVRLAVRGDIAGRLLCVEDDPANRELIRTMLDQRPGITLEMVHTGAACIAAARRVWPDLLLLDLSLPDMPGLDVLKVLRQLNPHLPLPCLVVSDEGSPEDIARTQALGAGEHLTKPIDLGRLLSSIDRLIAPPHPGAAASPAADPR